MTKNYSQKTKHGPGQCLANMSFDPVEFVAFLDNTGWSDEEKSEYVALLWGLVCEFVSLGFNIHPIQLANEDQKHQPDNLAEPAASSDDGLGPPLHL